MEAYLFNSNNLFLRYSNKHNNIQVYQLQNSDAFPLTSRDWKFVAAIGANEEYNSLNVFGIEIADDRLRNLQEDLCHSHLMINPEGFCYLDTTEIVGPAFNLQYYRLNDLFSWSEYVDVPSDNIFNTSWDRRGMQTGETLIDRKPITEELNEKSRHVKRLEHELESIRKQLAAAKTKLKATEEELKHKQNELSDTNNKIFQYEVRLDDKDKKLEKLRERISNLEQSQNHNKEVQESIQEVTTAIPNEADASTSRHDAPPQMRKEMLIEWQKYIDIWNQNKERKENFYVNIGYSPTQLFRPQFFEGTLREFTPVDDFTYPEYYVNVTTKPGQFDAENWWCIGSHEHKKRIDLTVYDGTFGEMEAYGTKVYLPYRQKYFFASVQCFVGLLRGVGFRFMYVSAVHDGY